MKSFFIRLRALCVSLFPLVVFFMIAVNLFVAFGVYRSSHPRYFYQTSVVTNQVVNVVTAVVNTVSSPVPSFPTNETSHVEKSGPSTYDKPYEYFVLSSLRMARIDGITYSEGDVCSRGLILRIFPDRIFLHNGDVIENVGSSRFRPTETPKTEFVKHDRRTIR